MKYIEGEPSWNDGADTTTVKPPVAVFPFASDAEQLTAVVPTLKALPLAGVHDTATLPLTRSVAVALNVTGTDPPVEDVALTEPGSDSTGGVVSTTVTANDFDAALPAASVAVHVTVVVPRANMLPDPGTHTGTIDPLTRSVALAAKVAVAPDAPAASLLMFAGTVTVGALVSRTVTVNDPVAWLPALSDALQFTVVTPSGNVLPDAGAHEGVTAPLIASDAEAV